MPKTIKRVEMDEVEEDWPSIEIPYVPTQRPAKRLTHKQQKRKQRNKPANQVEEEWPSVEIQVS
jgi:hypothetical protein